MHFSNMYKFALLLVCFPLAGCESSSDGLGEPSEAVTLECDGFFDSGDYSSMCFVDGTTPVYMTDPSTPSSCIYRVGDRPDSAGDEISVLMNHATVSVPIASDVFTRLRQRAIEDMDEMVTDISGVGDDAYLVDVENDLGTFVIIDKALHVRFRNLILAFGTTHDAANQPSCTHSNSELEKFAHLVIENITAQQ